MNIKAKHTPTEEYKQHVYMCTALVSVASVYAATWRRPGNAMKWHGCRTKWPWPADIYLKELKTTRNRNQDGRFAGQEGQIKRRQFCVANVLKSTEIRLQHARMYHLGDEQSNMYRARVTAVTNQIVPLIIRVSKRCIYHRCRTILNPPSGLR